MQWYVYALLSISRTRQMQINEPYVEKTIAHMDTYGQTSWSILESPKRHWFSQTWGCKRPAFAVSRGLKLYLTMMTLEFGIAQLYSIIEILLDTSRAGKKNDINRAETTKNREIHQRCPNCQFQMCDLTPVLSRTEPDLWGTCFTSSWRACSMIAAMVYFMRDFTNKKRWDLVGFTLW